MTLSLICHPDFPAEAISAVEVEISFDESRALVLNYSVFGEISELEVVEQTEAKRTDYLWQKTWFEAFIGAAGEEPYLEFNLSPSTEWAVYAFEDHRRGMRNPDLMADPKICLSESSAKYTLVAELDLRELPGMESNCLQLAATAVIEEKNGRKSLWALAHPSGNPDFHNRDCFVHQLEGAAP